MLANFLNKSKPINFIGLLVFFFLVYVITVSSNFFLPGFSADKLIKSTFLLILFFSVFFMYNFIVAKNKLTHDNSYAYYLFTLLIITFLSEILDYKTLILMFIYLLFVRKIYSLRSSKKVLEKLFDSSFWLGVLFLLESNFLVLFLLIYIAAYLHNKITIQTLLVPVLGFMTPIFLYFTYLFWFDKIESFSNLFIFNINFDVQFYLKSSHFWLLLMLLVLIIFSIFSKSIKTLRINNTFKKSWILVIFNFLILILFILIFPAKNNSEIIFILFPISIILANGIELIQKKLIKNLVLYFLLLGAIFYHFFL
ncbi:MAG: DUF6427 family protein [Polaribacter sp.]|uniref:DUF6427 family protein n=1 Tax=Polaribacter sp. TaxID=1920175 RepID=UPI003BAE1FE4